MIHIVPRCCGYSGSWLSWLGTNPHLSSREMVQVDTLHSTISTSSALKKGQGLLVAVVNIQKHASVLVGSIPVPAGDSMQDAAGESAACR